MKRLQVAGACAAMGIAALAGCAENGATAPRGVTIKVAPLDLPGVGDASYTLTVYNDAGDPVWTQSEITANQYGNGEGDITYIGTCDADDGLPEEGPATATNSVELVLESLTDVNGNPITEFQNPCPAETPCTQDILCTENADAEVTFNITILRDANQGFFDIAVNFQDLFCSAKFDCAYADGAPIKLLFNGQDRDNTSVLAFACTAGANTDTQLYLDDIEITCDNDGDTFTTVVETAPTDLGNQGFGEAPLFDYAVYQGLEQLAPYTKLYWNVALGWDLSGLGGYTCHVRARATAAEDFLTGSEGSGWFTPESTSYPVIDFTIDVGLDEVGNLDCGSHPLNGDNSGVTTQYSLVDGLGECFDNQLWQDDPDLVRDDEECDQSLADWDKAHPRTTPAP